MLIDQTNQNEYIPLNNIAPDQAKIEIYNSLLSEAGVLGFEYGYSLADPRTLVLWEAQFGDFANGAQVDHRPVHRLAARPSGCACRAWCCCCRTATKARGRSTPRRASSAICSSAPNATCAVCNPTTPANYFHALRRQLHRNFRKPLVIFTPKSLLRHKLAVSSLADLSEGSAFQFVIPEIDAIAPPEQVRRVVLCTRQGLLRPADGAARARG